MFQGYKTYMISFAGIVVAGAYAFGYIGSDVADKMLAILGFGGLMALRAGVSNG